MLADLGAYLLPSTPIPPHTIAMLITGAYDIPAVEVVVTGARTNRVPTGPYRGAGAAEAAYLIETAVAAAARELGVDVRAGATSSAPSRTGPRSAGRTTPAIRSAAWTVSHGDGVALGRSRAPADCRRPRRCTRRTGASSCARAATPSGEGLETAFAQIAADALDVELDRVDVRFGDTAELADGVGSFSSRSVAMGGAAVALAARGGERAL